MRILKIMLRNLNSLVGEWSVDLTDKAFEASGIFAVTGPTGAGKTTLFDAICLALYGQTPRVGRISASGNDVMSLGESECSAEVEFQAVSVRYRCLWRQNRARGKADGNLQNCQRQFCRLGTDGAVVETFTGINEVERLVAESVGMSFDQFTRSMMLPQNEFANFLKAGPNERAPILERITGTEMYGMISIVVYEQSRRNDDKLQELTSALDNIKIMSPEEEEARRKNLEERREVTRRLNTRIGWLDKALAWFGQVEETERILAALVEKLRETQVRLEEFKPDEQRLEAARKAVALEDAYAGLRKGRTSVGEAEEGLKTQGVKLRHAIEALAVSRTTESDAKEAFERIKAEVERERPLIAETRMLDGRIATELKRVNAAKDAIRQKEKEIESEDKRIDGILKKMNEAVATLDRTRRYFTDNAVDAGLIEKFAVIESEAENLERLEGKKRQGRKSMAAVKRKLETTEKNLVAAEKALQAADMLFKTAEEELGKLREKEKTLLQGRTLKEWFDERGELDKKNNLCAKAVDVESRRREIAAMVGKSALEQTNAREGIAAVAATVKEGEVRKTGLEEKEKLLAEKLELERRIVSFEEERHKLEDGKPCPLCGATDHPLARGKTPEVGVTEKELRKAKAELKKASEALVRLVEEKVRLAVELKAVCVRMEEAEKSHAAESAKLAECLAQLGISPDADGLDGRLTEFSQQVAGRLEIVDEVTRLYHDNQQALEAANGTCEEARKGHALAERAKIGAEGDKGKLLNELKEAETQEKETTDEISRVMAALEKQLTAFGVAVPSLEQLETVVEGLKNRRNAWGLNKELEENSRKVAVALEGDLKAAKGGREAMAGHCAGMRDEVGKAERELEDLRTKRKGLYGEKDPDAAEKELVSELVKFEKALSLAVAAAAAASEAKARLEADVKTRQDALEVLRETAVKQTAEFGSRLVEASFADEAAFLASSLPRDEREALEKKWMALKDAEKEAATLKIDTAARLEKLHTERPTEELRTKLEEERGACKSDQEKANQEIGGLEKELSDNEQRNKECTAMIEPIERQRRERDRWEKLRALIGSHDGKVFRNFTQGLTFDILIRHANEQLGEMSDRYQLVPDRNDPLDAEVVDLYQAGEIRKTRNLSGGESFIVSLALALGLSRMASRKARVDSLFLDEGFGNLDGETLESAIDTLAGLREEGKLIGVISHFDAVKERIPTQIKVTPCGGGRSVIEGPGCAGGRPRQREERKARKSKTCSTAENAKNIEKEATGISTPYR